MREPSTVPLLDTNSAGDYLVQRGVLTERPSVLTELSGGVSNVVLLAETATTRVVVKQALERLRAADDWRADRSRVRNEASALRLLIAITPDAVPTLLDEDPDRFALTIEAAPPSWVSWKDRLMAGVVHPWVARWLGGLLHCWHAATKGVELPAVLDSTQPFHQLRIAPYFRTSARNRPDLAAFLDTHTQALLSRRECLVLGDFSPKNVLVGERSGWVIDHEVAHRGDPTFDVAFMISHLLLKSVHLPAHAEKLRHCVVEFLDGYGGGDGAHDPRHLWGVVGCLLLARVVGSSPATYLHPDEAGRVERAAAEMLRSRSANLDHVWELVVVP